MPTIWIPAQLRSLSGGQESVQVPGSTVREIIDALDAKYPGLKERLAYGQERRTLSVVIDGQVNREGLEAAVKENSEVHFIFAIGGGQSSVVRCP